MLSRAVNCDHLLPQDGVGAGDAQARLTAFLCCVLEHLFAEERAGQAQAAGKKEDPRHRMLPGLAPQIELVHACEPVEQDEITQMALC